MQRIISNNGTPRSTLQSRVAGLTVAKSTNTHIYSQSSIKQILIKYIYDNVTLSTYNYKQLLCPDDLKTITNTNYIVVPCIEGYNYLFVVMKNKDRFYSYLIDRKMLKNSENQVNIDEIFIIPVEINFTDNKIYDGTIFEGTYHFTKQIDPITKTTKITDKIFIINDVYMLNGKDVTKEIIKYKYMNIESYLKHFQYDNNIKIYINKYIELSDINKLENCVEIFKQVTFDNVSFDNILNGLYIYPYKSGTKLVYNFNKKQHKPFPNQNQYKQNQNKLSIVNPNKIKGNLKLTPKIQQYKENLKEDLFDINKDNSKYKLKNNELNSKLIFTFEFRETDIEENYNLFLIQQKENNIYETVLIDNAGVFDIQTSELCKTFGKKNLIDCEYNNIKNKWIPLKISIAKHPTIITEFLKYFDYK